MVDVIPVVNAEKFKDVKKKLKMIEPFSEWAHIDVADETFTPNTLWHTALDLVHFKTNLKLEIHMMQENPEELVEHWFLPSVKRIIVHWETVSDMDFIIRECHGEGIEVGLAIADKTSWKKLVPWASKADLLQVLCVPQGFAGQEFHAHNLIKVKHLRLKCPDAIIEVDGGMNPHTARLAREHGADIVVAASYILNAKSPEKAILELRAV